VNDRPTPSLGEALRAWAYVAVNSFGGPAGQIAVMHREIVERRHWLPEKRFLHALNYCMLLPGPEAHQLAVYIGWLLHGVRGGLAAGTLFVLPGALAIMALSILYAGFQDTTFVQALFYGIKPAVIALVAVAAAGLARRALRSRLSVAIAVGAFGSIFFFEILFPLVIAGAALVGIVAHRRGWLVVTPDPADLADISTRPPLRRSLAVLAIGLGLWLGPVAILLAVLGPTHIFTQLGAFFSGAAAVTFGGAYAVLTFVGQQAVEAYGWLTSSQMLDGLGMAESTPGPLIMVVQFVGFMAAFGRPTGLEPMVAGFAGGLLVTWVTFVPSFLWIFLGAPYAELLRAKHQLTAALNAITAAVVGVIANLALWFALQTLFAVTGEMRFGPLRIPTVDASTLDPVALLLVITGWFALVRLRWPLLLTLAVSAGLGFVAYVLTTG
jgi:chromate transporter